MLNSIRSKSFVIGQVIFIVVWALINYLWPKHIDTASFDLLKVILISEFAILWPILHLRQHQQLEKDRHLQYNDYILNCHVRKEIKDIRPMIEALHKDLKDKIG